MSRPSIALAAFIAAVLLGPVLARAEERAVDVEGDADSGAGSEPSARELARQDQNPITRFYVMRFEDNVQLGYGPHNEAQNFFRLQPLIPIELGPDWTLLTRVIIPIVHQPWPRSADGLGDISLIAFLTPARVSRFIWGLGPAMLVPTATDKTIGFEKWSAGPAVAAVYSTQRWVVGVVAQNLWSFSGDDERQEVSLMSLRPLVNYNLPEGWYLTTSPSIVANWQGDDDDRWLVPVGGGVGKVYRLGGQRLSTTVESYYHAETPGIGPEWQMRMQLSFLYPD